MHLTAPITSAAQTLLEGGNLKDAISSAGEGAVRGGGGFAGALRPDLQALIGLLSNRQYLGGTKEIWQPEDAYTPGKVFPNRKLEKLGVFAVLKALPAVNRFMDGSGTVDWKTGVGSVFGVTNYKYGAEERLKANAAKATGYAEMLGKLSESDPDAASKMVQDPNKAVYVMFHRDLSAMIKDLKDIDKMREEVLFAKDLAPDARKGALDSLTTARENTLKSADSLNDALYAVKSQQLKKSVESQPTPAKSSVQ